MTAKDIVDAGLRFLEIVFSWPLILVVLLVIYRNELPPILRDLAGRLKKGPGGLEFATKDEVKAVESKVDALFTYSMAPPMYENLRKLATGHFGSFVKNGGLSRELYHLRDVGYIQVNSISAIPDGGSNLSDYVSVTDKGKEFVNHREELEARARLN
jgi:hypothetical protein